MYPTILQRFPPGFRNMMYVEVFGGGGSVLLNKERSVREVLNDANGNLINLYRVVREHPDELKDRLLYVQEHQRIHNNLEHPKGRVLSPEQALVPAAVEGVVQDEQDKHPRPRPFVGHVPPELVPHEEQHAQGHEHVYGDFDLSAGTAVPSCPCPAGGSAGGHTRCSGRRARKGCCTTPASRRSRRSSS